MKGGLLSVKTAFIALGAVATGAIVRSFAKAGSEVEDLTVQFKVLLGSTEAAQARMEELAKFAQTTPFQLAEVAQASRLLQVLTGGALATGDSLRMVGDAAAAAGTNFEELAMWVGRAYSGLQANRPIGEALMRLTELGIVTGETRNEIEKLQQAGQGTKAWEALQKALLKSQGGMEALSKTVTGLTSTIKDQVQAVQRQILASGIWDKFRDILGSIVDRLNNALESGVFDKVGQVIFKLGKFMVDTAKDALTFLDVFGINLPNILKIAGLAIQGFLGMIATLQTGLLSFAEIILKTVRKIGNFINKIDVLLGAEAKFNMEGLNQAITDVGDAADRSAKRAIDAFSGDIFKTANKQAKDLKKTISDISSPPTPTAAGGAKDDKKGPLFGPGFDQASINLAIQAAEKRKKIAEDVAAFEKMQEDNTLRMKEEAHQKELARIEELKDARKDLASATLASASRLTSALSGLASVQAENEIKRAKAAGASEGQIEAIRKQAFERQKKFSLAAAYINTAQAITSGLATQPFIPLGVIAAATAAAAGAIEIAAIKAQKFQQGGFVTRGTLTGDTTNAMVNRGEVILNPAQQRNFMRMANGTGAGSTITFGDINISSSSGDPDEIAGAVDRTMQERLRQFTDIQKERDALLVT